ncbi:MAG: DUF2752 domain-containing protein [Lachnospiraceae bacterium]|nr:DUF2752 domain-containing protein [Lachnospiraceae bacterium]
MFYLFISLIFDVGCPILWITGISCAGCGMTRAWISLLHLDFKTAFYYHPLFWLPVVILFFYFFRNKMTKNASLILSTIAILLFLITYVLRMLNTSDSIVIFQPWEGIIGKIISQLLKI